MNFSHCDHDEKYLTLHDCIAERAYFENGKLGFEFDDGFWVSLDENIKMYPEFFRTELKNPTQTVKHFIKDERQEIQS